jgi:hypothetical protein
MTACTGIVQPKADSAASAALDGIGDRFDLFLKAPPAGELDQRCPPRAPNNPKIECRCPETPTKLCFHRDVRAVVQRENERRTKSFEVARLAMNRFVYSHRFKRSIPDALEQISAKLWAENRVAPNGQALARVKRNQKKQFPLPVVETLISFLNLNCEAELSYLAEVRMLSTARDFISRLEMECFWNFLTKNCPDAIS